MRGDFHTAQTRVGSRSIGLVEMKGGGATGWGEASPFPGQDESMDEMVASLATGAATPTLRAGINEAEADDGVSATEESESADDESVGETEVAPVVTEESETQEDEDTKESS